jgi:hypothetical protein
MIHNAPLKCVIDTNVAVIANNKEKTDENKKIPLECILKCVQIIREIKENGHVYIDDNWRILREYQNNLDSSGQPGVGDAFFKWLLQNVSNTKRCTQIHITETAENEYVEFPEDKGLSEFDCSDRKFVAVSNAHSEKPPILEGFDSKWWGFKEILQKCGVRVYFVCQKEIKEQFERKIS